MTKFLNISTDNTLGGNSPSDEVVSSQKALKTYIDAQSGTTDMTGATASAAGTHGLVPAPAAGDQDKVLHGDGTWKVGVGIHPDLFDRKWSDYELSDMNWLRADTFSWQDGGVYEEAYNHLADDIDGKSLSSETVAGITVQFYLADDGHKICPATEESHVASIYTATGVAWYYIIDDSNDKFKLPRVNPDLVKQGYGSTPVVGDGTALGFTSGTNKAILNSHNESLGTNAGWVKSRVNGADTSIGDMGVSTDATKSGLVVGTQSMAFAGKKYLYFYVGNFTQTAIENTAGLNAELFNNKLDINVGNATTTTKTNIVRWLMPDYSSGISVGAINSSNTYTAPDDGFLYARFWNCTILVNDAYAGAPEDTSFGNPVTILLSKGDVVKTDGSNGSNPSNTYFYPCKK